MDDRAVRDAVLRVFQEYDVNGNGTIELQELATVLKRLDSTLWTDGSIARIFHAADADLDGVVNFREFLEYVFDTDEGRAFFDAAREAQGLRTRPNRSCADDFARGAEAFFPRRVPNLRLELASSDDAELTRRLVADPVFSAGEAGALLEVQTYSAVAQLGTREWRVNVAAVQCPAEFATGRVVLFMHGHGHSCCISTWGRFWAPMLQQGFHLLAFDAPGFGRSEGAAGQTLPWRDWDADLVLTLLHAFGVGGRGLVTVFGQCMGGAMFLRALQKSPETFAACHVLHNCTIGTWPRELPKILRAKGGGVRSFWWCDPDHSRLSNVYREFTALMDASPELCTFVDLQRHREIPEFFDFGQVAIAGLTRGDTALVLGYCDAAVRDLVAFVCAAPRRRPGASSAPAKTMLQLGRENRNFKVFVRVRPPLAREAGLLPCCRVNDVQDPRGREVQQILVQKPEADGRMAAANEFVFERVFRPKATQEDVWAALQDSLDVAGSLLEGVGATVFAYGQTSSGKTHTIDGDGSGVMARIVGDVYDRLPAGREVLCTYVQLYNEDFLDLFAPPRKLSQDGSGRVVGAHTLQCAGATELLERVRAGSAFRASGATNMNEASSRSHAILTLGLSGDDHGGAGAELFIVDLAGSERVRRSGVVGARLSEAIAINQSLLALSNVTQALVENDGRPRAHIPYRDSALTQLLRNSLGGTAKTALFACVSPAADSLDETLGTLRFATSATFVKNRADAFEKEAMEHAEEEKLEAALADQVVDFIDGRATIPVRGGSVNCYGDFSAPADAHIVVLVHHYGRDVDAMTWARAFGPLRAAGLRYLAPDMPGHGGSSGECGGKPEDYCQEGGPVDVVLQVLDACGVKRASVMGYDWGGGVACSFALRHPTRTHKLVAWCASFPERCYSDTKELQKLQSKGKKREAMVLWAKHDSWHPIRRGQDLAAAFGLRIVAVRLRSAGGLDDAVARMLEFVSA